MHPMFNMSLWFSDFCFLQVRVFEKVILNEDKNKFQAKHLTTLPRTSQANSPNALGLGPKNRAWTDKKMSDKTRNYLWFGSTPSKSIINEGYINENHKFPINKLLSNKYVFLERNCRLKQFCWILILFDVLFIDE